MVNGSWIEWQRTELDGPEDYDNFVREMKKSCEKYKIKPVRAMLTSEGKVFPMPATKYPYEEVKSLGKLWLVRHKETKQLFVAKYRKVADLGFISTFGWWKMRQFSHANVLNGVEAFYDPKEKLFITIVEFCYYGKLSSLLSLKGTQKFSEF